MKKIFNDEDSSVKSDNQLTESELKILEELEKKFGKDYKQKEDLSIPHHQPWL